MEYRQQLYSAINRLNQTETQAIINLKIKMAIEQGFYNKTIACSQVEKYIADTLSRLWKEGKLSEVATSEEIKDITLASVVVAEKVYLYSLDCRNSLVN